MSSTSPFTQTAAILSIWISPGHDFVGRHGQERLSHGVLERGEVECIAGKGLRGDRYFGHKEDYKGQLTLIDEAVVETVRQAIGAPATEASAFRRNILTRGLDLNALIGMRFRLGEVELTGSEECKPCHWMNTAAGEGAHESLKGRGGLRCRITRSGILKVGKCDFELLGPIAGGTDS